MYYLSMVEGDSSRNYVPIEGFEGIAWVGEDAQEPVSSMRTWTPGEARSFFERVDALARPGLEKGREWRAESERSNIMIGGVGDTFCEPR